MVLTLNYIFISNAHIVGDKSIFLFSLVYKFLNIVTDNFVSINLVIMLLLILFIPITIILMVIYKLGLKKGLLVSTYFLYSKEFIMCYIETNNTNYISVFGLLMLSFLTLVILCQSNYSKLNKTSFLNVIWSLFNLPSEYVYVILIVSGIIYIFRGSLIEFLSLSDVNLMSYVFINFSLMVPMIILSRIIKRVFLNHYLGYSPYTLFISLVKELFNIDNYKLQNIHLSNFICFSYIGLPFLNLFNESIFFSLNIFKDYYPYKHSSTNVTGNISLPLNFYIYSFDDISYPEGHFENKLKLNVEVSKSLGELKLMSAAVKPIETGEVEEIQDHIFKLDKDTWIKTNDKLFYKESYLKSRFTSTLVDYTSVPIKYPNNYIVDIQGSYINNPGILSKFSNLANNPSHESKVDALTTTMIPHFFGNDRGYGFNPQSRDSDVNTEHIGKIDLGVDYNNVLIAILENKADVPNADNILDLMRQARRYAGNNDNMEVVFVLAFKGTKMASFIYDEDFHSKHGLDFKHADYQDLIGIHVTKKGLELLPQSNTYQPQIRIYDTSPQASKDDILATSAILSYISEFKSPLGITDDFALPRHSGVDKQLAMVQSSNSPGFNVRLCIDPLGKFKTYPHN